MGTSGSFLRNNTQDTQGNTIKDMPTKKVSEIDVKPKSDVRPESEIIRPDTNHKPPDASITTEDVPQHKDNIQPINNEKPIAPMTTEDEQRPQRQKYVNNRTSRLYELTLPFHKNEVEPQDQKVMDEYKSSIETAVNFLKDADNITNDKVLECLTVCKKPYSDSRIRLYRPIIGKHLCDLGFPDIFCKFMTELQKLDLFNPENELAVEIYRTTKSIAWNFTNVSRDICIELGKAGAIPLLLSSLTQKEFLPSTITEPLLNHMKGCLGILSNMVRLSPDNRKFAREHGAVKLLLDYSKVEFMMLKAKCFIILSFLITDAEVSLLESTGSVITFIIGLLTTALASESGLARGFGTPEILLALNNLALNDKNKLKVVESNGLAQMAIALQLQTPANKEAVQILAAELTWKLSFIEENRKKIKTENGLIDSLALLKTWANGKLKTACSGALWETFEGMFEEADDRPTDVQTTDLKKGPHVMISYQWDVQPRIIKLKEKLQNAGYNVWMDIDQMEGDLLGAMAAAVENSAVVLACVSQKYKDSTSCRTEATYAYKQNKPIIPLIVQPNYTADGWLGVLIGTLKYYPLFKDSMVTTEIQNIKNEIGERGKANSHIKDVVAVSTTQESAANQARANSIHGGPIPNEVSAWTSKHVSDWLKRMKMPELCNAMKHVNGNILIQMFKMSNKAPDFFYTRLERDFKMKDLMQILKFSSAIDELLD